VTPILVIGAGRMGGGILQGWRRAGAVPYRQCMLRVRSMNAASDAARAGGAAVNPPDKKLAQARTVLLAVKPQMWRQVAADYTELLAPDAVIVSILAGVRHDDLSQGFAGRRVVRAMPTTAVATATGVAAVHARDADGWALAHALFDPIATTVDIPDEALMDAAGGVCGSGPAYVYAFVEALEGAGLAAGLPEDAARTLARATLVSAAAYLAETGAEPAELRRQVTSPNGTTQASLAILMGETGLAHLLREAVRANIARARELAA
jgi:pyrroline-5-carboxylate reductase